MRYGEVFQYGPYMRPVILVQRDFPIEDERCIVISFGVGPDQRHFINRIPNPPELDHHKMLRLWLGGPFPYPCPTTSNQLAKQPFGS